MKKIFMWIGIGVAFAVLVGYAGKNFVLRKGLESGAKWVTGLNLAIDKLKLRPFSSSLQMKGVALLNPAGYEDKKMLNFPEIYGNIDILPLFKSQIYLREARLDMNELTVVKNKDGVVNIQQLMALFGGKKEPTKEGSLYIKRLELSIGKVVYKDYSGGGAPKIYNFDVGIDKEVYYDIKNPQAFLSVVLTRALMKTAVAKLANLDMGEMKAFAETTINSGYEGAKAGMQKGVDMANEGAASVKEQSGKAWDATKGGAQGTWDATKKKTGETTRQIQDFFGGK